MLPLIERHVDSGVAVITLKDSRNGNLLNHEMLLELNGIFEAAAADPAVRVLLLRSGGRTFCRGMDLLRLSSLKSRNAGEGMGEVGESVALYVKLLSAIHAVPKPVIGLLHGDVKAGGVGLAGACDIVISSERTTFELSEVFFGMIPANVLPFIFSVRITPQKARYLVITGKKIDAAEAQRIGLIDEVVPEAELEKTVRGLIRNLFRSSPGAVAAAKAFTRELLDKTFDEARAASQAKLLELVGRPEVQDAVAAFQDGMTPAWFGKYKPEHPLFLAKEDE